MNIVLILVGVFVLYELVQQQTELSALLGQRRGSSAGGAAGTARLPLPVSYSLAPGGGGPSQNTALLGSGVDIGLQGVGMALQNAGSALASAVPFVGAAFNAIFGSLMAASARRAAQARNENDAVVKGVIGWDQGVAQVAAAYNSGQIGASEASFFLMSPGSSPGGSGVLWKNFWNEVGPQVQPGRNGCQSGTVVQDKSGPSYCGGSYGAGCCVGYDDLDNSSINLINALKQAEITGTGSGRVLAVFASKYGGVNRPTYTVTFRKTNTILGL